MPDPLVTAAGVGLVGAVVAGPAAAYGLDLLPQRSRRRAQWAFILGAVSIAIAADLLVDGPGGGGAIVYLIAVLPGAVAYLAFRTLLASALVSLAPLYFVIGILTRDWPSHTPALALDRAVPLEPAWMSVYGSLYVFAFLLPLAVVRDWPLLRRAMKAYLTVMLVAYVGFVIYPTAAPRPGDVIGTGFWAWCLRIAYDVDPPHGCFPSLHVAYAFVSALTCYQVNRRVGMAALAWATLIGVSTLFTKQHFIVDVIAGAALACAACLVFLRGDGSEAGDERDRDLAPRRALGVAGIYAAMIAAFWVAYAGG